MILVTILVIFGPVTQNLCDQGALVTQILCDRGPGPRPARELRAPKASKGTAASTGATAEPKQSLQIGFVQP